MMLERVEIQDRILEQEKYKYLFTVEEINRLFLSGVPFRDAYRQVGAAVEEGRFERPDMLPHTHLGSIGNLGNEQILAQMAQIMAVFKPHARH
jgi:argininosuccinate lyase